MILRNKLPFRLSIALVSCCIIANLSAAPGRTSMDICMGGGDHMTSAVPTNVLDLERELAIGLKSRGATSHETYVPWGNVEREKGKYTFAFQDSILKVDTEQGLKWVPFLITGSAYSLPAWYHKSKEDFGYICLEHGEESQIQSFWNPAMLPYIQGFYRAFGKHYNKNPNVESVLLGVTGNYGETLVPASNLDWTGNVYGPYHTHVGWWMGDEYAVEAFRKMVKAEYSSIGHLNGDWGTTFTIWKEIVPRLPEDWPTTIARQWQAEFMLNSMTNYADFCMTEAKQAMPDLDIYLVVGGHAPAYHGFDATAQVKAAARRGVGVRITNEADRYAYNFAITRIVGSACRQYGTFSSYEPAGAVTVKGIAARTFNSISSGNRCLHWYEDGLRQTSATLEKWQECLAFAKHQREPDVDVAVFYPRRWMNLHGDEELVHMYEDFAGLRNAADYDFLDERMMDDLVASRTQPYKHLLVREDFRNDAISSATLYRFLKMGNPPNVISYRRGEPQAPEAEPLLTSISKQVHPNDDFTSGIYFTRFKTGPVLFLNQRRVAVDLAKTHPQMVKQSTVLEPWSMAEIE